MSDSFYSRGEGMMDESEADSVSASFSGRDKQSTRINVQKSIELLNDAVGSPSLPIAGPLGTPGLRSLSRVSKMESRQYSPRSPRTRRTLVEGEMSQTIDFSMVEPTMPLGPSRMFQPTMTFPDDVTTTNVALLLEEDPGVSASSGLFHDFLQSLKQNSGSQMVLNLLQSYVNACSDQVLLLKKLITRAARQQQFQKTYAMLDLLDQERMTWQLVHSLYRDRLETDLASDVFKNMDVDDDEGEDKQAKSHIPSEQNIMTRLFKKDGVVRQGQLVVDWLENCALERYEDFTEKVKYFSDQAVGWENTLHTLQKKAQGMSAGDRAVVDELDPDAATRQNRITDDLDKEDEARLLQQIFVCIRAGQLDKAQDICQQIGQAWRAASLEGWRLYHDPNYQGLGEGAHVVPVEGNPYRHIWKLVCWRMAQESQFGLYERAVYGSLSGNLRAVLPACQSWSDQVWAYFRCMVDTRVEQEVRLMDTTDREMMELPTEYWDALLEPRNIFQEIEASTDQRIINESRSWFRVVQKYIILGDVDALIEVMHSWITNDRRQLPEHLVRFMAHLVLFFHTIGHSSKWELCTTIVEAYVEDLIKAKRRYLVAYYVARLPRPAQVMWYARFLEEVEDREERQLCLQLAEEEDLDVAFITKTVVENIRNRQTEQPIVDGGLVSETAISEADRQKIEAIDWLVFDQSQRAEAMRQANALMRSFIAVKKHLAAREVFDKLPQDSVDVIYRTWRRKKEDETLPAAVENTLREYMCIKAYLDAVEMFGDWFTLFHKGRPVKPSMSVGGSFTDRVAFEHKLKQYNNEMERWEHQLNMQTRNTKDRIYNVLLFADGGWMIDMREEAEPDEGRLHQMAQLRRLHLPGLCLNLHYMLHHSSLHAECLQLADVVAEEQHGLHKEFSKEDLQKLLQQLRESSLALLDQNKDPLGYAMV